MKCGLKLAPRAGNIPPSGSKSLVRPKFCSAMLKACWRLCVALDRVNLWNSIRSGLHWRKSSHKLHTTTAYDLYLIFFLFSTKCTWNPPFFVNLPMPRLEEKCCSNVANLCLCIRALKASPSLQQVVKFWMLTSGYLVDTEQRKRKIPSLQFFMFLKFLIKNEQFKKSRLFLLKSQGNGLVLMSLPEFFAARSPCSLHLAPEQQSILGRAGLSVVFRLYFDHLDLNENAHIFSRDTVAQIWRRGRCHRLVRQSWMIRYLKARRWNFFFSQQILLASIFTCTWYIFFFLKVNQ